MSPEQADRAITLSRHTLGIYGNMTRAGTWPTGDLPLMQGEVEKLEAIAEEHPGKALKIETLIESWRAMIEAVRGKLS